MLHGVEGGHAPCCQTVGLERRVAPRPPASDPRRIRLMKRHFRIPAALMGLALLVWACSTTTFQSTWKAPDVTPLRLEGKKVAAVFMTRNPAARRRAEDAMAREIS